MKLPPCIPENPREERKAGNGGMYKKRPLCQSPELRLQTCDTSAAERLNLQLKEFVRKLLAGPRKHVLA